MAFSSHELRASGVSEVLIAWRRWRRDMCLTQTEAAAMAGVNFRTLHGAECGTTKPQRRTIEKLFALMNRWKDADWPRRQHGNRKRA